VRLSETIRGRSIVGRFLEHSRIFRLGSGAQAVYLFGSAGLMPRNLNRRMEVLVPIRDPALRARIDELFDLLLADDTLAWSLAADGSWQRASGAERVNVQERLEEAAIARARRIAAV